MSAAVTSHHCANQLLTQMFLQLSIIVRDSIYAIARICDRNSVWTSVCHTGGLYKNG